MNRTKAAIIAAFGELLEERPLNKITVKEIVDRCGVNRNTFYYHFRDIPSLLEETITSQADQIIRSCSALGSPIDCIAPLVQYGSAHRKAVLHIYRSTQRESFQVYLDRVSEYIVRQYVEAVTKGLFPASGRIQEKELLIKYYKCTVVGVVLDWLDAGMRYDLLAATVRLCDMLAGSGKQAFLKCVKPLS